MHINRFKTMIGMGAMMLWATSASGQNLHPSCQQADKMLAKGDYKQALSEYNSCLAASPDHTNGYFNRAGAYTGLKKYAEAIKDYGQVLAKLPLDSESYFNRGTLHSHLKHWDKAIDDLKLAVELKPEDVKYRTALSQALSKKSDPRAAIKNLDALLSKSPTPALYLQRGNLHSKTGGFGAAIQDFTHVIKAQPKSVDGWYQRGLAYFKMRQHAKATYDFTQVIHLRPKMASAWYNRGLAYQIKNQCSQANRDFYRACKLGDTLACKKKCVK